MNFSIPAAVAERIDRELALLSDRTNPLDSGRLSHQIQRSMPQANVALEDIQSAVEERAIKAGFSLLLARTLGVAAA